MTEVCVTTRGPARCTVKVIPAGVTGVRIVKDITACSKYGTSEESVQSSYEENVVTEVSWTAMALLVRGIVKCTSHGLDSCNLSDDTPSDAELYIPCGP